MDQYSNELFKEYDIPEKYNNLIRFPNAINKRFFVMSRADCELIKEYAEQIKFHAIVMAEKFAISNPDYPYPKEYENNYLEFWLTKSNNYQEAIGVIKLVKQYQQDYL